MSTTLAANTAVSKDAPARALDGLLHRLRDLVYEKSVTTRKPPQEPYTLASGRKSWYYCDTKKVTLSPEGSWLTGEILFSLLDGDVEAVGGLELGATFISTAVALVSWQHGRPIYGFTVRTEQKKHGTKEKVAESFPPDGSKLLCPGRKVAIVDDVVTEGGSILQAIDTALEKGCKIVAVIALVDRNEGTGGKILRARSLPYYPLINADEPGELTINAELIRRRVHRIAPAPA